MIGDPAILILVALLGVALLITGFFQLKNGEARWRRHSYRRTTPGFWLVIIYRFAWGGLCLAIAAVDARHEDIGNAKTVDSAGECPEAMPVEVEAKLLPVLDSLREVIRTSDWTDEQYKHRLERLYTAKDRASMEARVALMSYPVGEFYFEELLCAVVLDGNKASKLLELYDRCDMPPRRFPVPRHSRTQARRQALQIIAEGRENEECNY